MIFLNYIQKRVFIILVGIAAFKAILISFAVTSLILTSSCGIYKPSDARKVSPTGTVRARKNVEEGRGMAIGDLLGGGKKKDTTYQFATSNPMWRASLEILDFLPLSIVNYSGGIIATDWYNEGTSNESIKITIRFLTNEIRADGIKIIVHKKYCNLQQVCTVKKIESALENELQVAILKKAVLFEELKKNKKKKK